MREDELIENISSDKWVRKRYWKILKEYGDRDIVHAILEKYTDMVDIYGRDTLEYLIKYHGDKEHMLSHLYQYFNDTLHNGRTVVETLRKYHRKSPIVKLYIKRYNYARKIFSF